MSTDMSQMRDYIQKFDYQANEFDNINDGRLVSMLRQAAKDRAFIEASKQPVKKTSKLKPLRTGGRQPKGNDFKQLRNKAKSTGKRQDEHAAAMALFNN